MSDKDVAAATKREFGPARIITVVPHNDRRRTLLQYTCEWCKRAKKEGERWIVGVAAEKIGATTECREITILAPWTEQWASHPLAVHFCSEKHKEKFIDALFETASASRTQRKRRKTAAGILVAATVDDAREKRARGSPASQRRSAKRNSRPAVQWELNGTDGVRAHGLSICLEDDGMTGGDTSDAYGGA
jgi:hypothetical protein